MREPFRGVAALAIWLLAAVAAMADGKVFPLLDHKALIPDQQALIVFKDGRQTLVIETRFEGTGGDFAWIVPVPAKPEITAVSRGVMPTLRGMMAPTLVHFDWAGPLLTLSIMASVLLLIMLLMQGSRTVVMLVTALLGFLFMVAFLVPALGRARGGGAGPAVEVLAREIVGAYETTTLTAAAPGDLLEWLADNGYAADPGITPSLEDYIMRGWVFIASRLRVDASTGELLTPHPLALTFASPAPVYPMRLTAAGSERLELDLYVAGDATANARGMRLVSCHGLTRIAPLRLDRDHPSWRTGSYHGEVDRLSPPTDLSSERFFNHPELIPLLGEATVISKLSGTFTPRQMDRDITIEWSPARARTERLYSPGNIRAIAGTLGIGVFWAVIATARSRRPGPRPRGVLVDKRTDLLALLSAVTIGAVFTLVWPAAPVTRSTEGMRRHLEAQRLWQVPFVVREGASAEETLDDCRAGIAADLDFYADDHRPREEASPGNYDLALVDGRVQYRYFDAGGLMYIAEVVPQTADEP